MAETRIELRFPNIKSQWEGGRVAAFKAGDAVDLDMGYGDGWAADCLYLPDLHRYAGSEAAECIARGFGDTGCDEVADALVGDMFTACVAFLVSKGEAFGRPELVAFLDCQPMDAFIKAKPFLMDNAFPGDERTAEWMHQAIVDLVTRTNVEFRYWPPREARLMAGRKAASAGGNGSSAKVISFPGRAA